MTVHLTSKRRAARHRGRATGNAVALLGILIPGLFELAPVCGAEPPGPPPKVYLEVSFNLVGKGSAPDKGLANSTQNWSLLRSFSGYLEAEVVPAVIGAPPNERPVLAIRALPGGTTTVVGTLRDHADIGHENFGAGGSSMVYSATEDWRGHQLMQGRDLVLELFLDEANRTWNGTIGLGTWQRVVESETRYSGEASYKPGAAGGWQEPGEHHTTDPRDWQHPLAPIATGYFPQYSVPGAIPVDHQPAIIAGGFYETTLSVPIPRPPEAPGDTWEMTLLLTWTLRDRLPDADLVVRSSRYDEWMPSVQPDLSAGNPLHFVAQVESPTGDSLERIRVKKFTWTLSDTSREPGVALNHPIDANDSKPDLTLVGWTTDAEGQKSEHEPVDGDLFSSIEVHPHDWGAWATLRVQAELDDGRILDGRFEPAPPDAPDTDILLPRRHKDSKVALRWRELLGLADQTDTDDKDARPEGKPGADGDGLSLYEEYRGFYVQGEHVFLDPVIKDLFVLNDSGGRVAGALGRFTALSRLEVHELKPPTHLWPVNRNRRQGPTAGPQAALWIRDTSHASRPNSDLPAGTRPRDRRPIRVPGGDNRFRSDLSQAALLESMVLQALFQSVAVDRPGPEDRFGQFELQLPPAGSTNEPAMIRLPNTPVVVLDFFGDDVAKKWSGRIQGAINRAPGLAPAGSTPAEVTEYTRKKATALTRFKWLVGEKGGAHSGPEECVMRDWFADIYRTQFTDSKGRPIYRLIDPPRGAEKPGRILGTTRRGTGVNDPNRKPEPRYGDSHVGAPANRQMIIADHLP